eukprot:1175328-Prorocentrum_minimum.AAC.2
MGETNVTGSCACKLIGTSSLVLGAGGLGFTLFSLCPRHLCSGHPPVRVDPEGVHFVNRNCGSANSARHTATV